MTLERGGDLGRLVDGADRVGPEREDHESRGDRDGGGDERPSTARLEADDHAPTEDLVEPTSRRLDVGELAQHAPRITHGFELAGARVASGDVGAVTNPGR